jgi:hypothetical protein
VKNVFPEAPVVCFSQEMTALAWPKGWALLDSEFFHAPMLSIRATEETVDLLHICHVAIM